MPPAPAASFLAEVPAAVPPLAKGLTYPLLMSIALSHDTALEVIRLPGAAEYLAHAETRLGSLAGCSANLCDIRSTPLTNPRSELEVSLVADPVRALSRLSHPLHVTVPDRSLRRSKDEVICHVWQDSLLPGSLVELTPRVYVTSPELTFLHLVPGLSVVQAADLACELAGTYVMRPGGVGPAASAGQSTCLYGQPSQTTVRDLREYAEALPEGTRGRAPALRALRFAVDGAASPREADLVLMLCLPPSLGGFGIPFPEMNHRIDLDERARSIARRRYCVGDLFWPGAGLDVEYHGIDYHAGRTHLESDTGRKVALESMGIMVIGITNAQLEDSLALEGIAGMIMRRLGVRQRKVAYDVDARRRALRHELLGL